MLSNKERLEWLLAEELAREQIDSKSQANMTYKIMDVFIKHDIPLYTMVNIIQEIDAIGKEYQARSGDVVSLTDILKIRNNKGEKHE